VSSDAPIVIAGGTGFIGRRLAAELASAGATVIILTRREARDVGGIRFLRWQPGSAGEWQQALEGAAAVVNLCGESIAGGRWSDARKRVLIDSRVEPARALAEACRACSRHPGRLLQASGVGYYGTGARTCSERTGPGHDFLAELARAWEAPAAEAGIPAAVLRFGVVLGVRGGALPRMLLPFRAFTGGPIGNGAQWLSWIHLTDVASVIRHLLSRPELGAVYNVTAPQPVRNAEFAEVAARVLHRPNWLPVPKTVLRLMLGEQAMLVCEGQRAVPDALLREGFEFRYPDIESALADLVR